MQYIEQNGLEISNMSLGTVQLGMNYGINNAGNMPDEVTSHEIIKTALKYGVNVLDTAFAYGVSEEVIGGFLKKNPHYNPIVVTKCRVDIAESPTADNVDRILYTQVLTSLKRLGIGKIPILLLHNENDLFNYGDAVPSTLKKMKAEGLVERVGVSLNSHKHIDYIVNSDLYEAVQLPMNLMDAEAARSGGLEKLRASGKIVFVRSVFLQGLFFKDPNDLPAGILQKAAQPLRKLRTLAQETGLSVAELALVFVRDLKGVSSLVLGCESLEQVQENLALMDAPKLSEEIRNQIVSIFDGIDPRIAMPWAWNE